MKSDFLIAITQLSAEKKLSKEVVIAAVEAALASAFKKENFAANQNISVRIDPTTGAVKVCVEKIVVELPSDNCSEISLAEARQIKQDVQIGETSEVEVTPRNAGRIAAQTAKQVILQRLHEAEHSAIFEEYADREGDIVTGLVQRIEPRQILIDLGRTEAVLPTPEQVRSERYRVGQRLKVYLLEVIRTSKGPQVIVSRSHPNLLQRLFELEVPEIFDGIVELKSIAREAGYRSKVAVAARQDGIDPVGCCVGLRGIRIQNIVSELNGEKIDVVMWNPDTNTFVANALSPAQILSVNLDDGIATVVVPDKQLSLAIGKEGQNARLAAKLTGWRIDIKSASVAEAERVTEAEPPTYTEEEVIAVEEIPAEILAAPELVPVSPKTPADEVLAEEVEKSIPFTPPEVLPVPAEKPRLRFAEDILVSAPTKTGVKVRKKKKKSTQDRESDRKEVRSKKARQTSEVIVDDEEY
ncbi:transcription termination factor NusA [Chloroflexota bacterium]